MWSGETRQDEMRPVNRASVTKKPKAEQVTSAVCAFLWWHLLLLAIPISDRIHFVTFNSSPFALTSELKRSLCHKMLGAMKFAVCECVTVWVYECVTLSPSALLGAADLPNVERSRKPKVHTLSPSKINSSLDPNAYCDQDSSYWPRMVVYFLCLLLCLSPPLSLICSFAH